MTVNLSSQNFSVETFALLEKGLTFIPSRRTLPIKNILQTKKVLIRNVKLRSYFNKGHGIKDAPPKTFVEKSSFDPSLNRLSSSTRVTIDKIEGLFTNIITDFGVPNSEHLRLKEIPNLSKKELSILKDLRTNTDIIIKPADKGGATVILDKSAYLGEVYRQLNNTKYYRRLDEPVYHKNAANIRNVLQELLNEKSITFEQFLYLTGPKEYKPRNFYILPKIHKPREAWPCPNMPEGRPICSDVDSETYRVSSFIDSFINPLSIKHDSYVKNSFEFVKKLTEISVENDWLLVTGDVSSLYTNMHFDRTVACVRESFLKYPGGPKRPDRGLLKLLEIILKNNDFSFNNEFFLQILGTAMGKVFSPSLANLYLLELDEKARTGFKIKPILFIRYLDDIFFIWPGSIGELTQFQDFLNSLIKDIKITFEYDLFKINFLDVTIYKSGNKLLTKTYFKETDTHQLLHMSSFHPKHVFKGLIKSQLLRFKRLSSLKKDYDITCKILFSYLTSRGYNSTGLRKAQYKVWFENGETENSTKNKGGNTSEILPIVVDYCKVGTTLANNIKNILKDCDFLAGHKIITAYKNSKNFSNLLISSRFINHKMGRFQGCGRPRCLTCKMHAQPGDFVTCPTNKRTITVQHYINCGSKYVIYIITCSVCKKLYVGETSRALRDRLCDHKSAIKNKLETPIGVHFNLPGHSFLDLRITGVDIIENIFLRKEKEIFLQKFLETGFPLGINNTPTGGENYRKI